MALDAEHEHFVEHGWLLTDLLDDDGIRRLQAWIDEIAAWPDSSADSSAGTEPVDRWLHHRELTDDGPQLCRTENVVPFHPGLRDLLTTGRMLDLASGCLTEPAVLYKDKINYKLPGGAGYAPHQDAPAYPFIATHVSCMVAIDDADETNGCLEVVSGRHGALLPTDDAGCIRDDVVDELVWEPVEVRAGQALFFHSRTPHRSGPNRSAAPRRAIYPTYNAASEGDRREEYYRAKLAAFAAADDPARETVQVSLIGDFQGRAVR